MRTLVLIVTILLLPPPPVQAQETDPPEGTPITGAQVSGLDLGRLSPGLQAEIGRLAGAPLDRQQLREIAARIEAEQPQYVAAVRTIRNPAGEAWVIFVAARIRDQGRGADANAKYLVEDVDVRGVPDRDLDPDLQAALQALVGKPHDAEEAERLADRLRDAFPNYEVSRRTVRGGQPGRVRLIFDLRRVEPLHRWLRLEPPQSSLVFHSDQGWGAYLPLMVSVGDFAFAPILAFDHGDHLVEEYSGFGVQLQSRSLGTDRLGFSFEWTTFDQDWKEETVAATAANPHLPALYRNRATVTPMVRFSIVPQISVAGGVGITELDALDEDPLSETPLEEIGPSRMANVYIGLVNANRLWRSGDTRHSFDATFTARLASPSLESDFDYERYFGWAGYGLRRARHRVFVTGQVGGLQGEAPLFERFTLGDSRTLRGWNKYDIAPAGADRLFHLSGQYEYGVLALFLDNGAVWDAGSEVKFRVSAGVGLRAGPFFMTVGVPLNTDDLRAVFAMGFGGASIGFRR